MKVEDLILQLQDVISAAKSMPFSGGKVMVSSDEIYDILDQIQDAMPAEVRQAKNIVADRKQILAEANRESENIIRSAEERKKAMLRQRLRKLLMMQSKNRQKSEKLLMCMLTAL